MLSGRVLLGVGRGKSPDPVLKDKAEDKWDELSEEAKELALEAKIKMAELKDKAEDKWDELTGDEPEKKA